MKQILFVISDLHLGGAPASDGKPSFQMCSEKGRARLSEFIQYAASQRNSNQDVHLVINGDIVDFLAEEKFSAFTDSDKNAGEKLENILNNTDQVWKSLKAYLSSGAKLTLLLGNHDIELSLPGPRRVLLERLGPGRVEFIYDNQAFVEGPVLIEHGNRYDSWNVISHDALRELRSALSRGEKPPAYECPAGSHMVINIMNKIKADFPFVDLLKPEDAGLLPLLAVLDPPSMDKIKELIPLWRKQSGIKFDEKGRPQDQGFIAGSAIDRDKELIALASKLARGADTRDDDAEISGFIDQAKKAIDTVRSVAELWQLAKTSDEDTQLKRLYDALRARAKRSWQTFDVNQEDETYLRPAEAAAERGFQVVIFGHTHLVKRNSLKTKHAVYLNSGTWADLMRVPEAILSGKEADGIQQLKEFVKDLKSNALDKWRVQVPTYAKIELDSNTLNSQNVYFFDGGKHDEPVPDGQLTRLVAP